jgi:hypothetical protein
MSNEILIKDNIRWQVRHDDRLKRISSGINGLSSLKRPRI